MPIKCIIEHHPAHAVTDTYLVLDAVTRQLYKVTGDKADAVQFATALESGIVGLRTDALTGRVLDAPKVIESAPRVAYTRRLPIKYE
jgi:hypothetical protein